MKIEHAAVYVRDLESAKDFFVHYFAARAGQKYRNETTQFESYFLSFAGGARLELMTRPELQKSVAQPAVGYAHIAFSVGSREEVDRLTAQLKADGCRLISGPRVTGDGYYESCVAGPEEICIELTI